MSKVELWKGDCLEEMKKIKDKSIDMILCDLPYGTTACKWDSVIPFEPLWRQYKRIIKDRGCIALFGSEPFSSQLRLSNLKWYKYDWVWIKNRGFNFASLKYIPWKITENISIFYNKAGSYIPQKYAVEESQIDKRKTVNNHRSNKSGVLGDIKRVRKKDDGTRYPQNVLSYKVETGYHETQKPVALLEYLIKTYTNEEMWVLDNTMGSGSTGVACVNLNRNFIGIEQDEKYFEIAKERIEVAQYDRNVKKRLM